MEDKDSFFGTKDMDDILMSAAKSMHGYIYYNFKAKRMQCKDGSWKVRIDVYEKYRRPSRKFAALLKKYDVEAHMHRTKTQNCE
jgi:hypothetical protein